MIDMDVDEPEQWPLVSKVFMMRDTETNSVIGVHVTDHNEQFSANVLRFLMQAVLYAVGPDPALDNVPVALMHYLPAQQRMELSLSDTGSEEACLELRNKAESEGLAYFLRRFKASVADTCIFVEVRYKSLADVTTGNVVTIVDMSASLPEQTACPQYHDFFSVARTQ